MLAGPRKIGLRLGEMVGAKIEVIGRILIEPLHHDCQDNATGNLVETNSCRLAARAILQDLGIHFHDGDLLVFHVILVARLHRCKRLIAKAVKPLAVFGQIFPAFEAAAGLRARCLLGLLGKQARSGVILPLLHCLQNFLKLFAKLTGLLLERLQGSGGHRYRWLWR